MKIQAFIVLSLAATVLALPDFRSRRQANATSVTTTTTMAPSMVPNCGSSTPPGAVELLGIVGNILNSLLMNIEEIQIAAVLSGNGSLINLTNVLNQVRIVLANLLGGASGSMPIQNVGQLAPAIARLTGEIDLLLGNGMGQQYACNNAGGSIGRLLQSLLGDVQNLITGTAELGVLKPLLDTLLATVTAVLAVLV